MACTFPPPSTVSTENVEEPLHLRWPGAIVAAAILLWSAHAATGAVYYVNGHAGSDTRDGLAPERAMAAIQEAASRAAPGDRIVVARGVYYGPVELKLKGTAERPITLQAEDGVRNAVIITNASRAIREGRSRWKLVDANLGLWRAPLDSATCRVLYSGTDLQPYSTLEGLRTFVVANGQPGPAHGYFYDTEARQLHVRLHASGKYGPSDPARHVMSAGPRTGNGHAGTGYNGPTFFNLGLMERGDIHVIVDGFTFETPGFSGVHANGSHVTVRNSWFLGCRAGVTGRKESPNSRETSNHITVENCDYTQYPAFDDMMEIIRERRPAEGAPKYPLYWWSRKGGGAGDNRTYETGICGLVGSDWTVRHNRVHDAFEGLSTWSVRWSKGMRIHDNVFERLVDNAIEMEDHAEDMRIYRNLIVDTVEPLSWQPLGGEPWPGPVYVYENVIRNDGAFNRLIAESSGHRPGWFKAGASQQNWTSPWNIPHMKDVSLDSVRAPGAGVVIFNNTVIFPGGHFLTVVQPHSRLFENFHFINNISVAQAFAGQAGYRAPNMIFRNNVWVNAPAGRGEASGGETFAGEGGVVLAAPSSENELIATDFATGKGGGQSVAFGKGVAVPEAASVFPGAETITNIGAVARGHEWSPPVAGPQTGKEEAQP
jgi:hypothetical protein